MGGLQDTTSQPITEPVTLGDMKAHLNVDPGFTDDDDLISGLITSARQQAEDYTARSLVTHTWLFTLDAFPIYRVGAPSRSDYDAFGNRTFGSLRGVNGSTAIKLPRPPLLSVTSVQYSDLTDTLQTLDPSQYQVDAIAQPGRILPAYGCTWPLTAPVANAVQVAYQTGIASLSGSVLLAIKLRAAALYANREDFQAGQSIGSNGLFEQLLDQGVGRVNIFGTVE